VTVGLQSGLPGGVERIDVASGQVVVRHPDTGALRIICYPTEITAAIKTWHDLKDTPSGLKIEQALPMLSEAERHELTTGEAISDKPTFRVNE
jgi:hypothetical protein